MILVVGVIKRCLLCVIFFLDRYKIPETITEIYNEVVFIGLVQDTWTPRESVVDVCRVRLKLLRLDTLFKRRDLNEINT